MKLSKRLETIARCVPANTNIVADIGTDHGYIPIYLVKNKIAQKAIACDMNPSPLKAAAENIESYGLTSQIYTQLGNGLEKLENSKVNVILISGMGGLLIRNILKHGQKIIENVDCLILQPQSNMDILRKYLHTINFKITEEKLIKENGRFYTIIVAKPGREKDYSFKEYLYGKKNLEKNNDLFKEYIFTRLAYLEEIQKTLASVTSKKTSKRLDNVIKEISICKEILKCQ